MSDLRQACFCDEFMSYEFERTPSPKETLRNVLLNNPSYTDLSSLDDIRLSQMN